jgi:hypothetical protein
MQPQEFQPPDFDRLQQSRAAWEKEADREWELYKNKFWQQIDAWIEAGVDEELMPETRRRGAGKSASRRASARRRDENTPFERRYEWAAKYLLGIPVKEIAGPDDSVSTVGRVARAVIPGWDSRSRRGQRFDARLPRQMQVGEHFGEIEVTSELDDPRE